MNEQLSTAIDRTRARLASERVTTEEEGRPNESEDDNESYEEPDLVPEDEEEGVLQESSEPIAGPSLEELQAERERVRTRSSICSLIAVVVLLKLWIDAMVSQDLGLIILCFVGTSWTARILRYHQDREDELDEWIQNYDPNGNNTNNRRNIRMLNYQAQLALAIMESQRQMMEGGYGHPDGGPEQPGVSAETRSTWKTFAYEEPAEPTEDDNLKKDAPHCSICLGEYEAAEELTKLPCGHVYHGECIDGWTRNHTKCPLCNLELESEEAQGNVPLEVV